MSRFILPFQSVFDANGKPLDGAKLYFYETGTSTPKDTYSDSALSTANTNPVVADSQGEFGNIFLKGTYRVELKDKNDVTQPEYPTDGVPNADQEALYYDTVAAMKLIAIDAGRISITKGYYTAGDGAGGTYYIQTLADYAATPDGYGDHALANGNVAVLQIVGGIADVKLFGAKGDGSTNDYAPIQRCFDLLKGDDATGADRKVSGVYLSPPQATKAYAIETTLVVDGTHGGRIFADSTFTGREGSTDFSHVLLWNTTDKSPVIQIKGGAGVPSNPNFQLVFDNIGILGRPVMTNGAAATTVALAGFYIGALDGDSQATLNRSITFNNCMVRNARFGLYGGSPTANNTDHALITINNCLFTYNYQIGIFNGTGNAILSINDTFCIHNGWASATFAADNYANQRGANVYVNAGMVYLNNYVSGDSLATAPDDADIYQEAGAVHINGAWSDCHSVFYEQGAGSINDADGSAGPGGGYQIGSISGVRHYNGDFTPTDVPVSMILKVPGTVVTSCNLYGDIEIVSGLSGRPVFSGINFIRAGATFTGSGVEDQRTIINMGNSGNNAQILLGGRKAAVSKTITGATKANPCVITVASHGLKSGLDAAISSISGMTELNGNSYKITVLTSDTFSLNGVNSTGFTAYASGGTADVQTSFSHRGSNPPQILSVGTGETGIGTTHSLMQWKGAAIGDSSGTLVPYNFVDGSVVFFLNCYQTTTGFTVENDAYPASRMVLSTTIGFMFSTYDPTAGTDFVEADWVILSRHKMSNVDGQRESGCFVPPVLSSDPVALGSTNGGIYYNTTTDKLRVYAAGVWTDLHA